jgi:hypothetical protein
MAENDSAASSGDRLRNIISRIDSQAGTTTAAAALPSPYTPTSEKQVVPVKSKLESTAEPLPVTTTQAAPVKDTTATPPKGFSLWEAFKNVAIIFSLVVNLALIAIVAILLLFVFDIKNGIAQPLLGGLYNGFVAMDEAHIQTTIPVNTTIAVNDKVTADFMLPLQQNTNVILSQDTLITGATVTINGGILQLTNAPTTILLPQGTVLPVTLDLQVPVKQDIPVNLNIPVSIPVEVDIPLQQTELHQPFADLRDLFAPYYILVSGLPSSWGELVSGK